eukprot:PITA_03283
MGHYATNFPSKKSKKGSSKGLEGEELASQFEMEFTLIACMMSSMMGYVWYLDSGASFHMTSDENLFSALEAKDLKMCIEMGLPKGKLQQVDTCKGCTLGKYMKSSFHDRDSRAEAILERVHFDFCGAFSTTSTMKQRYYVIFIDAFSHKCWIYFMQKKDQTFTKFCDFKALVEKESEKKIKALISENDGEYVSQEFKDFCATKGIKRELMAPHNP